METWALDNDTRVLVFYDGQSGPHDTGALTPAQAQEQWNQAVRNAKPYRDHHRALPLASRRVLEDPIMQDSRFSQFIQAADMVGYAAFHHLVAQHPEIWPKVQPVEGMSKAYRRLSGHWLEGHGHEGIVWMDDERGA
ncbi:DUF3800 domain-containing protein [Kitasatospora sp. NPDC088783]|uniref:DUF3800 domain-containing protein n=1 Tax=Kitasatospora sp. NPDC088783 TaxID=3364077 RepID=UPI0037FA5C52